MKTSKDDNTIEGNGMPPCVGFTSNAPSVNQKPILAENSDTGVSTRYAQSSVNEFSHNHQNINKSHWYVLRATYGREKKAYDYIVKKGTLAFYPIRTTVKLVGCKRKTIEESLLPNIFFAYGTEDEIKTYVYDNINLPYLRFYYRYTHFGNSRIKEPLIVPNNQIESFRIICQSSANDIILSSKELPKFKTGSIVRVIDGQFKGVIGTVARYLGQQRVGIIIDGLLTAATAYIPSAFIEQVKDY